MFKTLLYKEIKNTIITFQFQFITILSVLICSAYIYIGLKEYETRLENYNILKLKSKEEVDNINVFSQLQPLVASQPKVFSIICNGTMGAKGSYLRISPFSVPSKLNNEITYNPYINSGFQFDFNKVVAVLLSLLAILISFNMTSEEQEKGTLKLTLSSFVPKRKIIMAKLLACQIAISITLLAIFFILFLILLFSPSVSLNIDFFFRIVLIFLFYQVYLFTFILIGGLFSILTKRSSTSLIINLFVWLLFTIVIPYGVIFISESVSGNEKMDGYNTQIMALENDANRKLNEWNKTHPKPGPAYTFGYVEFNERDNYFITRGVRQEFFDWCETYFTYRNSLMIDKAEKEYEIEKNILLYKENRRKLNERLLSLSVTNQLSVIVENLCNTSFFDYESYINDLKIYRTTLLSYIESKKGFSSRRWFTDDQTGQDAWVKDPEKFDPNILANDRNIGYKAYLAINVQKDLPERKLNLKDVPVFQNSKISISKSFKNSLFESNFLILFNALLFFLILVLFNKYYVIS
ncbi:MAG: ABC transporter permease [Bacteroidales bacterium]|nr:ABC transporter permease [Bacteroidales bacterium]